MPNSLYETRDPVFLNCRRETFIILATWLVFFLWVTGYCGAAAYGEQEETVELVLGIPVWVVWGVFVPWFAATGFTIWFCFNLISDDSLEASVSENPVDGANKSEHKANKESEGA